MSERIYQWEAICWIRTELKNVKFAGFPGIEAIPEENIVVHPFTLDQDSNDDWLRELRPGVVISPARTASVGGSLNCEDDVDYPITIQFFDRDMSTRPDEERLQGWLLWQQKARQIFSETDCRGEIPDLLWMSVPSQQWVEKQRFQRHRLALWAMPVVVKMREPRAASSRSGGINGE
jgi:hypothetical protein